MSLSAVRQALETALLAITPAIATAPENVSFTPAEGTAWQELHLLAATPDNIEWGPSHIEHGYLQVNLFYPLGEGTGAAETRAELIRSTFPRGASFSASGITTHIETTPEVGPGRAEADFYMLPVKVRFYANLRSA